MEKALLALFTKVPLLGMGPIGYLIRYFVRRYSEELYSGVKTFVNLNVITFKNQQLEKEFVKSSLKLKLVAKSYGLYSAEFEEAREKNRNYLSNLVKFDVARNEYVLHD